MLPERRVNHLTPQSYQIGENFASERVLASLEGNHIVGLLDDIPRSLGLARGDDVGVGLLVEHLRGALELLDARGLGDDVAQERKMLAQPLAIPLLVLRDEALRNAFRGNSDVDHQLVVLDFVHELELEDGEDRGFCKIVATAGENSQKKGKEREQKKPRDGFIALHGARRLHRHRLDRRGFACLPRSELNLLVFVLEQLPSLTGPVSEF